MNGIVIVIALLIAAFAYNFWYNKNLADKIQAELLRLNNTDVSVKWMRRKRHETATIFLVIYRDIDMLERVSQVKVYPEFWGPPSVSWQGENPPLLDLNALEQSPIPFID